MGNGVCRFQDDGNHQELGEKGKGLDELQTFTVAETKFEVCC